MQKMRDFLLVVLLSFVVWQVTKGAIPDPTDSLTHSSGMTVMTDYGTGCQYLAVAVAPVSLTPRMGANGKQICSR